MILSQPSSNITVAGRHCQVKGIQIGDLDFQLLAFEDFDQQVLQDLERGEKDDLCPLYGQIWPVAMFLSELLWTRLRMDAQKGKKVIEIGCGLGLPSLVCAKLGAHVVATDYHPEVAEFIKAHRQMNSLKEAELAYQTLDYTKTPTPILVDDWELMIASDILYEPRQFRDICRFFKENLKKPNQSVIIVDPGRIGFQKFEAFLKEFGLAFHKTTDPQQEIITIEIKLKS